MRARAASAPLRVVAAAVASAVVLCVPAPPPADAASPSRPPALASVVVPAIGFGYAVTSQGPLVASRFPAGSPSAKAAAGALRSLGTTIDSYQRTWQDGSGANQVQDLVVRFQDDAGAGAFVAAARRAIARGDIVSVAPLISIPGAQRATYFATTSQTGVGQTITMRRGAYAAVLSFFSTAADNPSLITRASAVRVAQAQFRTMVSAMGDAATAKPPRGGISGADVAWALLAAAVLSVAVATLLLARRRRESTG